VPSDGQAERVRIDLDGAEPGAVQTCVGIDIEISRIDIDEPVAAEIYIQPGLGRKTE